MKRSKASAGHRSLPPPNKALPLPRPCSGFMTCGSVWHWNLGALLGVGQPAVQLSAQPLGGASTCSLRERLGMDLAACDSSLRV